MTERIGGGSPAGDGPLSSLRITQRAPRSCFSCARRKVRCDKAVPCSTCIKRGAADTCTRETVIVRGQVTIGQDPGSQMTYDELLQENARLQEAISEREIKPRQAASLPNRPRRRSIYKYDDDDYYETVLLKATAQQQPLGDLEQHDVIVPSRECSYRLIQHDKKWNSWIHYAVEYPQFEYEHDSFMVRLEAGASLEDEDPSWLAIYFAIITATLITMHDASVKSLDLPGDDRQLVQGNWYSASLFFLYKADFMRRPKLQSVQAIAILGMCFINFGDHSLFGTMWASAIRISQSIGLDKADPSSSLLAAGLSQQGLYRLWWTLIICEWLGGPCVSRHVAEKRLVSETDFDVPLPAVEPRGCVKGPGGLLIHPVQYHIFMARTSTIYHRFTTALRCSQLPITELVRVADTELAEIITTLPPHLQPESVGTDSTEALESMHPWIRWQRVDVTLVLLYHRLRINRTLQKEWAADPSQHAGPRAVSLRTARDIIWISQNWEQPPDERREWPFAIYLFSAAIFIIRESWTGRLDSEFNWMMEVDQCIEYLEKAKLGNAVAVQALKLLEGFL